MSIRGGHTCLLSRIEGSFQKKEEIMRVREITIELTDFCEVGCKFCSSSSRPDVRKATFIEIETVRCVLIGKWFDHIILSGGEPLAHPKFYEIYKLCEKYTDDVVVYSNLIRHRIYNAHVIDGVYLEAKLTVLEDLDVLNILKRIRQGRELDRPEVTFSRNFSEVGCTRCDHRVVRPDGSITEAPCKKHSIARGKAFKGRKDGV
jgi:hypothetical protein